MADSPLLGRTGVCQSPNVGTKNNQGQSPVTRTRSGDTMVRPQPVTEQSLMESVAGKNIQKLLNISKYLIIFRFYQ